jgi:transposase InsO family protein
VTAAARAAAPAAPTGGQAALGVGSDVVHDGRRWTVTSFAADGTVLLDAEGQTCTATVWDLVDAIFDRAEEDAAHGDDRDDGDGGGDRRGVAPTAAQRRAEQEHARLSLLAAGSRDRWLDRDEPGAASLLWGLLTAKERTKLTEHARHMQEVLTGYKYGSLAHALPDEPREDYDGTSRRRRLIAKAAELGSSEPTVRRQVKAYETHGVAGLIRAELLHQSGCLVKCEPAFLKAVVAELDEHVNAPNVQHQVLYARVKKRLVAEHGQAWFDKNCPAKTQGYAVLNTLGRPRGFFGLSAKGRRSVANSPTGTFGSLRATRPGEYVLLDTTVLDVFAMDRATGMWVRLELTVAIDLFTRSVVAMRLTPYTSKSRDVAGLLFDCARPKWARERWHDRSRWRYHGLPKHVVIDSTEMTDADGEPLAGIPLVAPETIVIDHGKIYVGEHVRSVCKRMGISIQPARPYRPTDKSVVERWFGTLRTMLLQNLKGYKGPDIHSRGLDAEGDAFYFVDELEEILWEWVATIHQTRRHKGLVLPEAPNDPLTPNEMYEIGVQRAGFVAIPNTPDLAFDFLPIQWREISRDGLTIGLRYNADVLNDYRDLPGPRPDEHRDRWPFWVDPDDLRQVWFRIPDGPRRGEFAEVPWVHRDRVDAPFSDDVLVEAKKRVVARLGRNGNVENVADMLQTMLDGWDAGAVGSRREHRLALRNARARDDESKRKPVTPKAVAAAFPTAHDDTDDDTTSSAVVTAGTAPGRPLLAAVPDPPVCDDDEDADIEDDFDITDDDADGDYYADALGTFS